MRDDSQLACREMIEMKSHRLVAAMLTLSAMGVWAQQTSNDVRASTDMATKPAWLVQLIARFEADAVANPPVRVVRYRYRDVDVYYVSARCCDIPSRLYDANGAVLCAPDGGKTGRGDGRCADFQRAASEPELVWKDPRERISH
jgi:hypothetical protein